MGRTPALRINGLRRANELEFCRLWFQTLSDNELNVLPIRRLFMSRTSRHLKFFAALTIMAGASAFGAAAPEKVVTVEGITEYHLDNGLRLLFYPDNSRSKVTVNMTVLVGSR